MTLSEADLLTGVVRHFDKSKGWQVELVGGLKGWLKPADIQDTECDLVKFPSPEESGITIGSLIIVAKKGTGSRHFTPLTMKPSDIHKSLSWVTPPAKNQVLLVTVVSNEDHGYDCSLGKATKKHGIKVFVKKAKDDESQPVYHIGQVISVVVDAIKKESKIVLCRPNCMERYISMNTRVDVSKLIPGQLVECRIATIKYADGEDTTKKSDDGLPRKKRQRTVAGSSSGGSKHKLQQFLADDIAQLEVHISGMALAQVPMYHMHNPELARIASNEKFSSGLAKPVFPYLVSDGPDSKRNPTMCPSFTVYRNESCLGRIIAVKSEEKEIYISFLPQWAHWNYPQTLQDEFALRFGEVVENLVVMHKDHRSLTLCDALTDTEGALAFHSIWKCSKTQYTDLDALWQQQKPGVEHKQGKCLEVGIADCVSFLSLRKNMLDETKIITAADARVGRQIEVVVENVGENYLLCKVNSHVKARIYKEFISAIALKSMPTHKFKKGMKLTARVLQRHKSTGVIELTMKPAHLDLSEEDIDIQKELQKRNFTDVTMHLVIVHQGKTSILLRGFGDCVVSLPYLDVMKNDTDHTELTDDVVQKICAAKRYQPGAMLQIRVIRRTKSNLAIGSLDIVSPLEMLNVRRAERDSKSASESMKFEDISVGDIIPAVVTNVTPSGVFVKFEGTSISALARLSEALEENETEVSFEKGDNVLTKVLAVDTATKRINIGLKSAYFAHLAEEAEDDVMAEEAEAAGEPDQEMPEHNVSESEVEEVVSDDESEAQETSDVENVESEVEVVDSDAESEVEEVDSNAESASVQEVVSDDDAAQEVEESKLESEAQDDDEPSASESEEDGENESDNEATRCESDADADIGEESQVTKPTSAESLEELEKLVMIEGHSAMAWIRMMAYWAELGSLEKTMETVYRAMKVIQLEEKAQREDIWKAALNICMSLAKSTEERKDIIKEAVAYNDESEIYLHLLPQYIEQPKMWVELEQLSKKMLKGQRNIKIWLKWLEYLYIRESSGGAAEAAKQCSVLIKGPPKKRVKNRKEIEDSLKRAIQNGGDETLLTVHMAKLEYEYGSPELGRSKLLELLDSKSKRTDIWNVLLDAQLQCLKHKSDVLMTRQMFQRAVAALRKLSKVKSICTKWLSFETKHGTAATVRACQEAVEGLANQ